MQANDVNQALKRVSSDEIKRNYTQITGREALERLLAGDEIFSTGGWAWKVIGNKALARKYAQTDTYIDCKLQVSPFLDPKDSDWYVAPPFDARKEMLARPGEWVAKYETTYGWPYIGFDRKNMVAVESVLIKRDPVYNTALSVFAADADDIDRAIPLDDADLAKIASLSKEGE